VDGPLAARKLITAIHREIAGLPDFDPVLVQLVEEGLRRGHEAHSRQQQERARRLGVTERELQNVLAAVRDAGHSPILLEELRRLESQQAQLTREQERAARPPDGPRRLPAMAEVKALAFEAFDQLAPTSPEFGRLLRRLIPRIIVWPYRLCDGGHPVLRARFTFSLVPLLPASLGAEGLQGALQRSLLVDLFEAPQRVAHRARVMELTAQGRGQRDIARELGITQAAVQHAVALGRRMTALGIEDPYLPLHAPPPDYERWRRHKHPRYHFEPLTGAEPSGPPGVP
jgi:hypothetical protein